MASLTFKSADILDLPEIIDLIVRSKSYFHPNKEQYVIEFVRTWGPNAYYIEDNILLIAKHHDKTVGVLGMRPPSFKRHFAELDLLFIDENFIGFGYGKQLWNKAESIAKTENWNSFRFISDNIPRVIGFYDKMGAIIVGELKLSTGCFPIMEYVLSKD